MRRLISHEQNGFLAGRSTFDYIIDAQEIVHSLEYNSQSTPRMLLKINIQKAYDALEWNVILAMLKFMQFPNNWISWIRTYISSASFCFLINDQPTP